MTKRIWYSQEVFLFETAGFSGEAAYFAKIFAMVKEKIPGDVYVIGEYVCKGEILDGVRHRYEQMEESSRKKIMLKNFDCALADPGREDLEQLKKTALAAD